MHHGGCWGGSARSEYVGGSVNFFDYCDLDEISVIELCNMTCELGYNFKSVGYYTKQSGEISVLKSDVEVMGLKSLAGSVGVVKVYSVIDVDVDKYVATQFSQCLNDTRTTCPLPKRTKISSPLSKRARTTSPLPKTTKTTSPIAKRSTKNPFSKRYTSSSLSKRPLVTSNSPPISGTTSLALTQPSKRSTTHMLPSKSKAQHVNTPMPNSGTNIDSDEGSDEDVFYDSDYGFTDDDQIFEDNIDRDVEWCGLGTTGGSHGEDYAAVIEELENIDGDCVSSDELDSDVGSDDEAIEPREKYPAFNDKTKPSFQVRHGV